MKRNALGRNVLIGVALGLAAGVLIWHRRHRALVPPHDGKRALPSPNPDDLGEPGINTEKRLDAAIEESFPASDPVSIRIE
ncbi:MAG TPA: hypothetical protein VJU15_03285 [Gemmatimonadales bacterium]|nr:hypothetical protein [Gemmatimonadales bacterium]